MSIKINNKTIAGRSQTITTRFVGEIFPSALPIHDDRVSLLNGRIITQDEGYSSFIQYVISLSKDYPQIVCTEEEWQLSNTTYNECGKFVIYDNGTVRLPKIVSFIEGLSSLEDLGKIVEAGLPNITGSFEMLLNGTVTESGVPSSLTCTRYTGAFQGTRTANTDWHIAANNIATNTNGHYTPTFNASKSNDMYGKSSTVQPQAIRYPYYIVLATSSTLQINVKQELTTNNPFTLFESKYIEFEISNTSWLLSNGQWNSGDVYISAYNALVQDYDNENKLVVRLHTDTYNDYNFVLNKENKTFRLPLKTKLASGKAVVGNGMTLGLTNGSVNVGLASNTAQNNQQLFDTGKYGASVTSVSPSGVTGSGGVFGVTTDPTNSGIQTSDSDLYLYFYVGETNINANIVNVGALSNAIANKIDRAGNITIIDSYQSGASGYRIYSDGWCEQWGFNTSGTQIKFLKQFKNTDINISVTPYGGTNASSATTVNTYNVTNSYFYFTTANNSYSCYWKVCGYINL